MRYYVFDAQRKDPLVRGRVSGIGGEEGEIEISYGAETHITEKPIPDHEAAVAGILRAVALHAPQVAGIVAVAHRVAHGGDVFSGPAVVTPEVLAAISDLSPLAPEHNAKAVVVIRAAQRLLPDAAQVAVFDTAFFTDLPPGAATYALPLELSERLRIRKYGFHGLTHRYVSERASLLLGRHDLKQIVCYMGNSSSVAAVDAGHPVDVSTGFTTLEGLPMRTRSGSIDPGIHRYVMERTGMSIVEFERLLNEESGMLGLAGSSDVWEVWDRADQGDARATLAIEVCVHRLVACISAFHGVLGGAQAISFTGALGEQDVRLRKAVCDRLACFGVEIDKGVNAKTHGSIRSRIISTSHSAITVLTIQQREHYAMARDAAVALGWKRPPLAGLLSPPQTGDMPTG
jgi:acetate kinase